MKALLAGVLAAAFVLPAGAQATTRMVGPGHEYAKPCQAMAAAQPGDVIQIDAAGNGGYDGDVCASGVANLTIEGVNGRARIDAAGQSSGGKAIWVLSGADTVVRNVELSGAKVPDRNGAAIRLEGGGDLTLVGAYLHDNEDGILTGAGASSDVTIDGSELADNGYGDGQSHNLYIGAVHSFTLRHSYSHGAKVGHLVKSRAAINTIAYNRLTGEGGTDSYELDLPNGGVSRVVGNVIQQGPNTQNPALLAFGEEGATDGAQLTVINNTFVNDRPGNATAVMVGAGVSAPVLAAGNLVTGATTFVSQASAQLQANCVTADPRFVDRAGHDYHLQPTSPCRDVATPDPPGGLPTEQYVYDLGHEARPVVGAPDAGAFEWAPPAAAAPSPAPPAGGGGGAPTPPAARAPLAVSSKKLIRRSGRIQVKARVAGAGRLSARATVRRGTRRIAYAIAATSHPRRAGTVTLTLKPTRAGRRALRAARRLKATLTITYTSTAGARTRRTTTLTLRAA
jgi:Right handed beta helix region